MGQISRASSYEPSAARGEPGVSRACAPLRWRAGRHRTDRAALARRCRAARRPVRTSGPDRSAARSWLATEGRSRPRTPLRGGPGRCRRGGGRARGPRWRPHRCEPPTAASRTRARQQAQRGDGQGLGAFAQDTDDLDADAEGGDGHDDVREQDRRVHAVAADGLQRDLRGELGPADRLEDALGAAQRPVLGERTACLAHEPDRDRRGRLAPARTEERRIGGVHATTLLRRLLGLPPRLVRRAARRL